PGLLSPDPAPPSRGPRSTPPVRRRAGRRSPSGVAEGDAAAAGGIAPGDGALAVAGHVAGPALEALLVAEDDRTVREQAEEVGGAGVDAAVQGALAADLAVDRDVRLGIRVEADGGQLLLERGPHHPNALPPSTRSRTSRVIAMP